MADKKMKKDKKIIILLIGIFVLMFIFALVLVSGDIFEDKNQMDFDKGIFNYTFYNSSGFIQVNLSTTVLNSTENTTELIGNETGLITYWKFNESSLSGVSGEVKDVLGKNNGTGRNGANTTVGLFGRAGNFTPNSYVQIRSTNELNPGTGSFTIAGWAKSYSIGSGQWQLYVAKRSTTLNGDGYYVGLREGYGLNFMIGNGTDIRGNGRYDTNGPLVDSPGYIPVGYDNWFHFAAVINKTSNQILLYVNGTLGANISIPNSINISNSANLSIGFDEGRNAYPVKGQVDEMDFWNRSLNSSEILALYQKGVSNQTSNFTNISSGTYESNVKDAGSVVSWKNISWNGIQNNAIGKANVMFLRMNGNADDENGINNGTLKNNPESATGKNNLGYQLNGVNQYIEIADSNSLDLNSSFSMGLWVNFTSLPVAGQWQGIIAKGGAGDSPVDVNHNFFLSFDNNMGWGSGVGITWGFEDSAGNNYQTRYQWTPNLSIWYHIAGVFNDSADAMILYINGINVSQINSATGVPVIQNHPVFIGRNLNGSSGVYYLNAIIDDAFISNKSLSLAEIQEIYNNNDYSSLNSASNLRFQLRTSNDNLSWSNYIGNDGTNNSYYNFPANLNLSNSRYLQYKAFFMDSDAKLYNVSIDYENIANLTVNLDSPVDNYLTNEYNINIICSAYSNSELVNVTPYYSKFGWFPSEPARVISGTSNTTTFTLNEISSSIDWNCYFCNVNGECSFASSNKTIIGDILSPEINLVSPVEEYNENLTSTINFIFNATDNRASLLNCKLLIDNNEVGSNSSVVLGIDTVISSTLFNGNHSWKINCSDGINSALSLERNLTVNISAAYTPFWARANTHTHTTNSDGDSSPITVINLYKNLGYSIIAITDHGYVTNCIPFTNLSANFLCVNSEEWTSTKHVVRINVSAPYDNAPVNMQNAVDSAVSEGGFAIAAHPNWSSTIWSVSDLTSLQNYTAMEIYNKVIERLSPDPYAVIKWDDVLKTGKKIFGVAVDDMHQVSIDLGYGWTKVYMPEFTKQAYVNSMKTGYFYASQGPNMDSGPFILNCDRTTTYHMGESANCSAINVSAIISATNSSYLMRNITLVKDGLVINVTTCSSQNCSFSYSENVSSSGYYRLQAIDSYNKQIWSNPIWVTKIALPVTITVHTPQNNSDIKDYTPFLNISLNQQTSSWYNLNNGKNMSLCSSCSSYSGYVSLIEGNNVIYVYANNSDNVIKENKIYIRLNFNKSISENFSDNSSIFSAQNISWSNGKMSSGIGIIFGNFVLKPIITINNITGFHIEWTDNNTENAKGEGQRTPIILKYKLGSGSWIDTNFDGNYITNGSTISGLNGNNLSIMFDFEKNPAVPVDLLNFKLTWKEFTIPLISNVSVSSVTSSSAVLSWNTDLDSNSSVLYGTSSYLGSISSLDNSVKLHSITLTGLNPSTGYFYKVISCTDSSCSQDPQEPYTPYSFTTQAVPPVNPPSGWSRGGGGVIYMPPKNKTVNLTVVQKYPGLEISKIGNIIVKSGEKKSVSLNVKNIGDLFLNRCRLIARGYLASLFNNNQIQGIAPGENANYNFDLNIPEDIKPGDYKGEIEVICEELNDSQEVIVSIPKGLQLIKINELKYVKEGLKINYSFDGTKYSGSQVEVVIWILDDKKNEVKKTSVVFSNKKEIVEKDIIMDLPEDVVGVYQIYFALAEDLSNYVKQSVVLGKSSLTGEAIDWISKGNIFGYVILILIFGVIIFFVIRGKFKKKKIKFSKGSKIFKEKYNVKDNDDSMF